ncbi:DNA adenine methylase [uncultured Helicobacter sp.]|uniref:DNA adenine methylase n=1 Tax=uncultured Helicobacter sp. TaxID=175537 RepID=UPI00350E3F8F
MQYDSPDSLFYLDPPYVGTGNYYKMQRTFSIKEHKKLCALLKNIRANLSYATMIAP